MAAVRDFRVAFATSVARINLSCNFIRSICSPGISRIVAAGRFLARATVAFTGRPEDPFTFGGGTLTDDLLCWRTGLRAGASKDRSDSTVAEVHVVVEATALWIFAARADSSFRVMVDLHLRILANGSTDPKRRP